MTTQFLSAVSCLTAAFTLLSVPATQAADLFEAHSTGLQASTLRGSLGLRYWYSKSNSDLDVGSSELASTDGLTSHTAELVGTLEDASERTFFRGYVGLGKTVSGDVELFDTRTENVKSTSLGYVMLDGGWQFAQFANNQVRLKGFVGYHYLSDKVQADFGSLQIDQDRKWHALRLGLSAQGDLSHKVGWTVDVAGVPWSYAKVGDVEANWTYGLEADAMLNVGLTPNWQLGVGGRYWWLKSDFEETFSGVKTDFDQDYHRYGLLLESKYTF